MSQMAAYGWPAGGAGAEVGGSGLVLVARAMLSGAAALTLDQVFTPRFQHYLMHVSGYTSATATEIRMRLRRQGADAVGATDYAGSNWSQQYASAAATPFREVTTSSYWSLRRFNNTAGVFSTRRIELFNPALPTFTFQAWHGSDAESYQNDGGGKHIQSVAYDGFTIYPASGEFDHIVCRVYGYQL